MNTKWDLVPFEEAVEICDSLRKPINSKERSKRIEGKSESELFPYYGATGQVGYIDDYITDGEYVLLGEDGAPFLNAFANKAYIISGKTWVNNHAHVLKAKGDNRFLCYYLNHFNYKGYVSGTTRLKLTQAQMKRIAVPMPSLREQERIVAQIEELFSELDNAEATLQATKKRLAVYRQAVLKEAYSLNGTDYTEISEITNDIKIGPFGTMLHKEDYCEDGIPVINPQHIKNGKIAPNSKISISKEKAIELDNYRLEMNDVIMGRRGEMGRTAPVTETEKGWICGTGSLIFRLKPEYDAVLYANILSSPDIVHYLEEHATGTTMKNLNEGIVSHIPIPRITYKEQMRLNELIDERTSECNSIEKTIDTTLLQLQSMRQSVLKEAFEGRL